VPEQRFVFLVNLTINYMYTDTILTKGRWWEEYW